MIAVGQVFSECSQDVANKRKSVKEAGIAPVQLDSTANEMIQAWCDSRGAIKRTVLSKIVRWWMKTKESFQLATLGQVPPELSEEFAKALEDYAREIRGREKGLLEGGTKIRIHDPDAPTSEDMKSAGTQPEPDAEPRSEERPRGGRGRASR